MKKEEPATSSSLSDGNGADRPGADPEVQVRYLNLPRLETGTVISGRYRVDRLIGQGGFGMVFSGFDLTLKTGVALKFFNPDSLRDEKKFLRVQREINLARKISDPRIIKIYSLETWSGIWFMVMELVRGGTLKEGLKKKERFTWEEFQPVFAEILQGVGSLHREGIIHRDLKPSNIMVDAEGKVKILDFGLAKEIGDLEKTSSIGEIVGSPFYLSPEQIQGLELDEASDIYQLGILLYQALTGAYPFPDTTTMSLVLMHLQQKPDRIAARGAGVPEVVEFVVAKALAKKKQERFRSATEMAERLYKGSVPLLHSVATRVPRALRLAALAATALSLAAAAYFTTYGSRQVRSVQASGTAVRAMNRFGRTLWRRDFAPYGVHLAHVIHIPGSWYRPDQQNPVKYVNDNSLDRLQHQRPPVTLAFLSHPAKGVFARDDSINSDRCDNQMAVLGPNGKLLDQRSYSESFGLRAYDFAPVFNMNSFREVESEKGGEKLVLFQLQNFQGMYPSALVIGKGTSYSVLCSPGVILEAQVLRNDSRGISMLVLAANNLFSHMNYLTEWNCSPLAGRHTEIFPAYFTNHNYTTEEFPVFFPRISGIIENHWLKEGRVVLFDTEEGRTITVFRDGKMQITRDGKVQTYRDLPAVLARAYGLVNECFQQKAVRRNPQKALELAADAATLPVQNPFLRSALLCLRGECEALLGRNDESRKSFGQALYHFPRNNDAMKGLLEVEFFEKGAPAAIALFERAYSQGKNFFGLGDSGNYLFLGYAHLAAGQAEKAREYFEKIYQGHFPDSRETLQGILEMFAGNYKQAVRHLVQAESKVPGFFDIRELRLLLARALVLADYDPVRARWILEDLAKFSLRQGHMTEISLCHLLAREGKLAEARARVGPAFAKLRQVAAGDFETRLWLWYDAFVYARTMELLGNPAGARDGYAACVESNPHTALATEARQALAKQ